MDVILVDSNDEQIGVMEKMEAHEKGVLHRAFSIFIFNSDGKMLLQQRAFGKYHSGGLWTNACCSHPMPGEDINQAARRRLQEEMGFVTTMEKAFTFTYSAVFDNGLTENEFDHVFIGSYSGEILPASEEVEAYTFKGVNEIIEELALKPADYTIWFKIAFPRVLEYGVNFN